LRNLPSVDRVLRELGDTGLPRPLVVDIVRRQFDARRAAAAARDAAEPPADPLPAIRSAVDDLRLSRIQGVINGTGVIVHTNLGRAPLAAVAVDAITRAAQDYTGLEFDLATGDRCGRAAYVERALATLCGAEAATVVNNCAAALVLALRHLTSAARPNVVISRGELVQIGGGFRVPEILEASGATLREVGTTNRTTLADYAAAVDDRTAMILRVHRSNFHMEGFVASPSTAELSALARGRGVPFVDDLGSGYVAGLDAVEHIADEPTPRDVLAAGADLVTFSGDKLLGGPQGGIVAGRARLVAGLKREPFFRALRCDKLVLSALQATLDLHLAGEVDAIPLIAMTRASCDALRARADRVVSGLDGSAVRARAVESTSRVGGGSLPRSTIPSVAVELVPTRGDASVLTTALRRGTPPVIGHIEGGALRIDLRTVFPRQDEALLAALRAAADGGKV
jgi:L-seryl-tRNA(Ser) seleniumtransferase